MDWWPPLAIVSGGQGQTWPFGLLLVRIIARKLARACSCLRRPPVVYLPCDAPSARRSEVTDSTVCRVFDPMCGMWLEPDQVAVTWTYIGQIYSFCCQECRDLFARTPEIHLALLAHEPRNCLGHRCPFQRGYTRQGDPDDACSAG
jgi:YHS domain-containing protein